MTLGLTAHEARAESEADRRARAQSDERARDSIARADDETTRAEADPQMVREELDSEPRAQHASWDNAIWQDTET